MRVVGLAPELYPFASRHLDWDGLRYHYLDEGQGAPVVMVHGNPSWSFYYRRLVQELRADHRVIVPDHIGCGFSDKPDDRRYDYTLASRTADLDRLLITLGVDRDITLVVHDWGGMIGMLWAVRNAARVRRLVILNTAAFHLPPGKPLPFTLRLARNTRLGAFLVRGLNAFCRGAARWGVTRRPMPAAVRAAYLAPYDSWAHRIAVLRFVQDIPLDPADPAYAMVSEVEAGLGRFVDTPMCIGWGERDFVFDHQFLAEWTRRFPQAEVHRFPDAGHYVLEDAADELCPRIRAFLAAHPIAAPMAP